MTIQELYDARAKAWTAAKNFLDTHGETLSAEDAAAYERMEQEIADITAQIGRLQRLESMDIEMQAPTSSPIVSRPSGAAQPQTGRASRQYALDMLTAIRSNFTKVTDVLAEYPDQNGGYLVPDEWDRRLISKLDEENVMRGLGTRITTSGEHKINIAASAPAASWIAEGAALSFGDAAFEQKVLDAHKLHVAVKVTEELLYDNAFGLENWLINEFGKALGNAEEAAFITGDGDGKPYGVFDATKGGSRIDAISGNLKADDVIGIIYELKRPYRKNASFLMKDQTLGAVRKLKTGDGQFLWQPSFQAGEPDKLCGYPVYTSAYAPAMASGNPFLGFGDFSYYNIGDRGTRSMQQLRELFAGNGMIGYVMKERVDGILTVQEAVKVMTAA